MKRILRITSIALVMLFFDILVVPPGASGVGTIEVYPNQTEAAVGEEIVWNVEMAGWDESSACAFFLYRDAVLIEYQPPSDSTTYRYTPEKSGTYSMIALARDGTGVRTANGESIAVTVPLRIVSIAANRPRIDLGSVATWTVSVEEGSGGARFGFFVYRDGELLELCVPDDPESGVLDYIPEAPGTYTVDVLASDASGKAKMAGAPIVVADGAQGAEQLALTSVYSNTPDALVGEEIVWTATASGGEDQIAFSFFLYKDGELVNFTPIGTSSVFHFTPTETGVYAVSAHASSGLESSNLMSGEVTVAQPSGVRLTGVACDSNKAVIGETLTWTAQTAGAAGEVAYSFAMYRDYALMGLYETGSSSEFSFAPGEAGTYSVVAYARDDVRSASASSADVRVVSSGLFVDSVTADQLTGAVGEPITWTVHASGGEHLQYMYFVYFIDELVYSSPVTTENTFTYTPTESFGLHPYVLKGMVGDGEQTESFESPGLLVTDEGRARIISITPDRTFALPG